MYRAYCTLHIPALSEEEYVIPVCPGSRTPPHRWQSLPSTRRRCPSTSAPQAMSNQTSQSLSRVRTHSQAAAQCIVPLCPVQGWAPSRSALRGLSRTAERGRAAITATFAAPDAHGMTRGRRGPQTSGQSVRPPARLQRRLDRVGLLLDAVRASAARELACLGGGHPCRRPPPMTD